MNDERILRFGIPGAAAAWPFKWALDRSAAAQVEVASAERIAALLENGMLDCALLPPADALRIPLCTAIPGVGLCANGSTGTDVVCSAKPIGAVRNVAVDPAAGGALALAQIVLAEQFGIHPEFIAPTPSQLESDPPDATIVNGDAALLALPGLEHVLDLPEAWTVLTNSPCVLGLWVARFRAPLPELRYQVGMASQRALDAFDDVVEATARERGLDVEVVRTVLQRCRFRLGSAEMDSLRTFVSLAKRHGICREDATLTFC